MLEVLANVISGVADSSTSASGTYWLIWDEPQCPEELL